MCNKGQQRGFTLLAGIFILIVLAALGAFMVNISSMQHVSSALDVQGARAYQAARAGIEWGVYQVLDPTNATAVAPSNPSWPNLPSCPASPSSLTIEGFAVTVTCGRSAVYNESGTVRSIAVYSLQATATSGVPGSLGYIERQLQATVSKCRATDAAAPGYACN
jgi:MSHA biogenesis protein MshP